MRKFTKILESAESEEVLDIKDVLIDFQDMGFDIKVEDVNGLYKIEMRCEERLDWMECVRDLSVADQRLQDMGFEYVSAKSIKFAYYQNDSEISISYKKKGVAISEEGISGIKQFRSYCESVLGVYGMQGRWRDQDGDGAHWFRINTGSEEGFPRAPKDCYGWEIELNAERKNAQEYEQAIEDFAAQYPGYEDFLKKLAKRRLNWDLLWDRQSSNKECNQMKFDKEGIDAVKKLLEIAKKFPEKIEIVKP